MKNMDTEPVDLRHDRVDQRSWKSARILDWRYL
jgi:hypothetical protein